jgi:hypothetical protein
LGRPLERPPFKPLPQVTKENPQTTFPQFHTHFVFMPFLIPYFHCLAISILSLINVVLILDNLKFLSFLSALTLS